MALMFARLVTSLELLQLLLFFLRVGATPDQLEVSALLRLKHAITSGSLHSFSNWTAAKVSSVCSDWHGVTCNLDSSHVLELRLEKLQLEGYLPLELGNLTRLQVLSVFDNNLGGNLPVLNLTTLAFLDLRANNFTGRLPDTLGYNRKLKELRLGFNKFEGTIPGWLWSLSELTTLDLSSNIFSGQLWGPIPLPLFQCQDLKILSLSYNSLHGEIPPLNLTRLEFIDLRANKFTGQVPDTLGLYNKKLKVLSLGSNNFGGTIPEWVWKLSELHILDLSSNSFTGPLPQSLDQLQGFYNSSVPDSSIEFDQMMLLNTKGTTLKYDKILQALRFFDLSDNEIDGDIPASLATLTGLRFLNVSQNRFSGEIPGDLGNLVNLEQLDVSVNQLTGRIPETLVSLKHLSFLNVSFNNLSGPVPTSGQLGTFQASSYISSGLCSSRVDLMLKPCPGNSGLSPEAELEKPSWWLVSYAFGVVVGFSGVLWIVVLWNTAWDFTFPGNAL